MDAKIVLLYVEVPLLALLLIEIIVAVVLSLLRRKNDETYQDDFQEYSTPVQESTKAAKTEIARGEPLGYVRGADAFLDGLSPSERAEFYRIFINSSRCGLNYKIGGNNAEFFSGVFIYLGGVRFVVSDGLMRKICIEYDRLRGLPATAH